jgi:hypothetical protein
LFKRVLAAIKFDSQLRLWARKIDNALPNWMLAPELPENELFAQCVPERAFNIGRLPA